ncbi:hypothetical protein FA95DRAFT_1482606 [Auriscalpium vulgare]|uniref:Uncharacterized protein n=1 Tax=Auriscalpium vulgare TaxID=40419 RepID=A0ACB8SA63_9AGAM|nr:hypothetical protein FA95DRAFT_1482606 [Auriscalpium vulgare]
MENAELVNKLKKLENELSVWKDAHSAARDAAEREKKIHEEQVTALRRQRPDAVANADEAGLIYCVIDGTRTFFTASYLKDGDEGGRRAGQDLIRAINRYVYNDRACEKKDNTVWIAVYVEKKRLVEDLGEVCTAEQFAGFCDGLSQASDFLHIVDVANKKDADYKIRQYLQTYAKLSQTQRFFFTGGYGSELSFIAAFAEAASATSKLVVIQSHNAPASGSFANLPILHVDDMFMKTIPVASYVPRQSTVDQTPRITSVSPTVDDEMISQIRSPTSLSFGVPRRAAVIDPSLPLYKQNPPPCNEHYLLDECSKNGRCKYSHDYILTDDQLATLAKNAKQSPCWFLNNSMQCPYGETCCWGHVCPFGVKCHFLSKDKCRFKGRKLLARQCSATTLAHLLDL